MSKKNITGGNQCKIHTFQSGSILPGRICPEIQRSGEGRQGIRYLPGVYH